MLCSPISPEVFEARSRELEQRLQQSVARINARLARKPLLAKAAFVTFNDLASTQRCLAACPNGETGGEGGGGCPVVQQGFRTSLRTAL